MKTFFNVYSHADKKNLEAAWLVGCCGTGPVVTNFWDGLADENAGGDSFPISCLNNFSFTNPQP